MVIRSIRHWKARQFAIATGRPQKSTGNLHGYHIHLTFDCEAIRNCNWRTAEVHWLLAWLSDPFGTGLRHNLQLQLEDSSEKTCQESTPSVSFSAY